MEQEHFLQIVTDLVEANTDRALAAERCAMRSAHPSVTPLLLGLPQSTDFDCARSESK